jgi:hypothetical protein
MSHGNPPRDQQPNGNPSVIEERVRNKRFGGRIEFKWGRHSCLPDWQECLPDRQECLSHWKN